ncbi:MAG: hypothetical protein ACRDKT_16775 [Actinomycetota bacterium]
MTTYSDAVGWLKAAPLRARGRGSWAGRALDLSVFAGLVLLGLIGLLSPSSYGNPGSAPLRTGWPWFLLLGVVGACVLILALRARRLRAFWRELKYGDPAADEAVDAAAATLERSPSAQTRFVMSWVWGPITVMAIAVAFAFSTAYFAVDAILARFQIGWQQPLLGIIDAVIAYFLFLACAPRGARVPIAYRIYRAVE